MMRKLLWVGMIALAFQTWVWADCTGGFQVSYYEVKKELSIPIGIIIKKVIEEVPVVGKAAKLVKVEITFTQSWGVAKAVCVCEPCCEAREEQYEEQYMGVIFSLTARVSGGTVVWSDVLSKTQPGEEPPVDPERSCSMETEPQVFSANTTTYGFGVDLPIGFTQATVEVSAWVDCKCTQNPECKGNAPPVVVPFGPIELEYGKKVEFWVTAIDKNKDRPGNLTKIGPDKREGCLTVSLEEAEVEGEEGRARFSLSYSGEGELLKSCTSIRAKDACGSLSVYTAEVFIFYPPVLRLLPESGWKKGQYEAWVRVYDPNLKGCPYPQETPAWEVVEVKVKASSGIHDSYSPQDTLILIPCNRCECQQGTAEFTMGITPEPNECQRWLEIEATDAMRLTSTLRIEIPNRAPTLEVSPGVLEVKLEETEEKLQAHVAATDPDEDTVFLIQTGGPGTFDKERGTWSWTVPKKLRSFSTWVGFAAKDRCGGVGYGFLNVHTVNPPEVSDAFAIVPRGGESETYTYVHDPDSPWVSVSVDPDSVPSGLSVSAQVKDDPFAPGMGGFMVVFKVSAAPTLCEGEYEIPFTVTDSDGLSSSATLHVRVVGNRAPEASPPEMQGKITVTLTRDGVVYTPVVFTPIEVSDPDGDPVTIEGYGLPPMYAANISAFLGSLVAMYTLEAVYTPDGLTDKDLCRAVREKDVLSDEFSLLLRDACGAQKEVPVTVTIRVVDKIPPKIVYPAQSKTVECDGQGNVQEFQAWLESHGGASASDNCCEEVTWSYKIDAYEPSCGGAGRYRVTFVATDCAGNSSSTSAEFVIVDTVPPHWDQPMPGDMVVECQAVPPAPLLTASDTCAGQVPVEFHEERVDGPCPHTYTLVRTWTATDGCHTIAHTQRITVRDTTPPDLTVPPDVDLGCNPPDTGPDVTGWATAQDNCDPNPMITYTDNVSAGGCQVTIKRTWRATDACGNTVEKVQRITYIQDTTPPDLVVPPDVTVECHLVPPVGEPTATDNCDPAPVVEYLGEERVDGPCPYMYSLVRTWRALDACGNETRKSQTITVRDTTPPVLTVPPDVDLGCNPPDTGPDVTGWATAQDNCDPNPMITYTDNVSAEGCQVTIKRTWRATDACGNTAEKVQQITYLQDTTPPTIHCPSIVTAYVYGCSAPDGTWVNFPITATDDCDSSPQLSCSSWGGWFPVGTTPVTVECTATDRCGNSVTEVCSFTVTVERVNHPPVAQSDSTDCNGFCCISVLANDYDPDGDPITLVEASARCGSAWVSGNTVCYTTVGWSCDQPPGLGVSDTITYTITDGCSYATGTVYIRITCQICPLSLPPGGEP